MDEYGKVRSRAVIINEILELETECRLIEKYLIEPVKQEMSRTDYAYSCGMSSAKLFESYYGTKGDYEELLRIRRQEITEKVLELVNMTKKEEESGCTK